MGLELLRRRAKYPWLDDDDSQLQRVPIQRAPIIIRRPMPTWQPPPPEMPSPDPYGLISRAANYQPLPPLPQPLPASDQPSLGSAIGNALGSLAGGLIARKMTSSENQIPQEFRATGDESRPRRVLPLPADPTILTRAGVDATTRPNIQISQPETITRPRRVDTALPEPVVPLLRRQVDPLDLITRTSAGSSGNVVPSQGQPAPITRPQIDVPTIPGHEPFGSSGEPFGSSRPRRTQPRDFIADDAQYLRDLQANPKEMGRKKAMGLRALLGFVSGGIPGAIGGLADEGFTHRLGRSGQNEEIARTQERLGREVLLRDKQTDTGYKNAQKDWILQRPDIEATKIADRSKTANQRMLATILNARQDFDPSDPVNASLVEALTAAGMPVVPKRRGQKLQYVHDESTGRWSVISGDATTGLATGQHVMTGDDAPLATTSTSQLGAEVQEQNRQSRERIVTANSQSRENIAAQNRQSREAVAARRGTPRGNSNSRGYKLTERQIRDHAKQRNLDPEELVRRARAAGDIQ